MAQFGACITMTFVSLRLNRLGFRFPSFNCEEGKEFLLAGLLYALRTIRRIVLMLPPSTRYTLPRVLFPRAAPAWVHARSDLRQVRVARAFIDARFVACITFAFV